MITKQAYWIEFFFETLNIVIVNTEVFTHIKVRQNVKMCMA